MPTVYVNKSGDDTLNGGTSPSDAFLTIQKAIDAAASLDTIEIGSGVYNEGNLNQGSSPTKNLTVRGDGFVVIDGTGIGSGLGFRTQVNGNVWNLRNLILQNYSVAAVSNDITNAAITMEDCVVKDGGAVRDDSRGTFRLTRVLLDNTNITYGNFSILGTMTIEQCTLINGSEIDNVSSREKTIIIKNCHLGGDLDFGTSPNVTTLNYNNILGNVTLNGVTYTSLASLQAANPTIAPNSISQTAFFNQDFTLRPISSNPNIGTGESGVDIGVYPVASEHESTDGLFEGVILSNVITNANGDFQLDTPGSGTITSAVLDLGSDVTINTVRHRFAGTYPGEVVDFDNTDIEPNRRNFEYRFHTNAQGAFGQLDGSPSYVTAEWNDDIAITARYFQMRITLRSDGVAA